MSHKLLVLVAGLMLAGTLPVHAQELVLDQVFSHGVSAYYGQNYGQASGFFNTVIESSNKEPRGFAYQELCYYYRGLCSLHLGHQEAAKTDFQKGAELETNDTATGTAAGYNVARLLERVQGSDRQLLEQYRVTARMVAMKRNEALLRLRYEQNQAAQSHVLQPAEPTAAATAAAGTADGFQMGPLPQSKAAATQQAEASTPSAEQPAAAAAADMDPFATPTDALAGEKSAKKAKPAATDNAAEEKPADATKADDEKPAATEAMDQPAGDDQKPAEKPAADEKPATAEDNAAKPAADNPFGAPTEKPAAEEKPATEKPAAKKPASSSADDDDT